MIEITLSYQILLQCANTVCGSWYSFTGKIDVVVANVLPEKDISIDEVVEFEDGTNNVDGGNSTIIAAVKVVYLVVMLLCYFSLVFIFMVFRIWYLILIDVLMF